MWHDHLFSLRKKKTERAVRVGVGGNRQRGGGEGETKSNRREEVGNIGVPS